MSRICGLEWLIKKILKTLSFIALLLALVKTITNTTGPNNHYSGHDCPNNQHDCPNNHQHNWFKQSLLFWSKLSSTWLSNNHHNWSKQSSTRLVQTIIIILVKTIINMTGQTINMILVKIIINMTCQNNLSKQSGQNNDQHDWSKPSSTSFHPKQSPASHSTQSSTSLLSSINMTLVKTIISTTWLWFK